MISSYTESFVQLYPQHFLVTLMLVLDNEPNCSAQFYSGHFLAMQSQSDTYFLSAVLFSAYSPDYVVRSLPPLFENCQPEGSNVSLWHLTIPMLLRCRVGCPLLHESRARKTYFALEKYSNIQYKKQLFKNLRAHYGPNQIFRRNKKTTFANKLFPQK